MSTYRLDRLFAPRSVALVGASPRQGSLGSAMFRTLRDAGFSGPLDLVNPRYPEIDGLPVAKSIRDLQEAPDVAVVAVPPDAVPAVVADAAECGVAAAIIITAGLGHGPGSMAAACEASARAKGLRLVGPNCLGVMAPRARFNATFAAHMPQPGDLALVSQSGAIAAGMIEWAVERALGFSAIASIGDQLDVDFGDCLDFLALDPSTRVILLYVESIKDARKFMSAARAAARTKPVVVIKAGRHAQAARAAATHTGAVAGSDVVYDAAFRRAGLLRVIDLGELFEAAETLGRIRTVGGNRLAILTNGGGVGVLAVDRLIDFGGFPALVSAETIARLDAILPPSWSKANPVDIIGDADPARYVAALEVLLADSENDAVLVLNVETALASATGAARAVADFAAAESGRRVAPKPVLAAWIGTGGRVAATFTDARIPHYDTETEAVRGFMHLVRHREAMAALMETPPSLPVEFFPAADRARRVVDGVIAAGRTWLDPIEVNAICEAYGIPATPSVFGATPREAAAKADLWLAEGQAVAVKILSHDIVHKSDVGGVQLGLIDAAAVEEAAAEVIASARVKRPDAHVAGVTVHPMMVRPKARELLLGVADDATFGPVIVFGHGGVGVEVIDDKAVALPPLDLALARDLIGRTRVARLLSAYRNVPAARTDDVALVLVRLAQLAADLPELRELDINPLLADEAGVLALDMRIAVAPAEAKFKGRGHPRFAVRPYPSEWERHIVLGDGWRVFVRPIRPEDEAILRGFFARMAPDDLRLRFFAAVKDQSHAFIARLTQLDYARAIAFIAIDEDCGGVVGSVSLHADVNYERGEYAVIVRSDLKGRGLGWALMQMMLEYAHAEGLRRVEGQVLRENTVMLRMCQELGFSVTNNPEDSNICLATLELGSV
ncbi:MAG TPA: bifunctional acetate--CoA ligase family protein/GNAT family N-acetyltransferase [Methylomirabilota bacterium]|nr:bifunctional acetate--CoA ligase family protein/GNAT family N-acetyltransferase [Methylomirabilota bacterium]